MILILLCVCVCVCVGGQGVSSVCTKQTDVTGSTFQDMVRNPAGRDPWKWGNIRRGVRYTSASTLHSSPVLFSSDAATPLLPLDPSVLMDTPSEHSHSLLCRNLPLTPIPSRTVTLERTPLKPFLCINVLILMLFTAPIKYTINLPSVTFSNFVFNKFCRQKVKYKIYQAAFI